MWTILSLWNQHCYWSTNQDLFQHYILLTQSIPNHPTQKLFSVTYYCFINEALLEKVNPHFNVTNGIVPCKGSHYDYKRTVKQRHVFQCLMNAHHALFINRTRACCKSINASIWIIRYRKIHIASQRRYLFLVQKTSWVLMNYHLSDQGTFLPLVRKRGSWRPNRRKPLSHRNSAMKFVPASTANTQYSSEAKSDEIGTGNIWCHDWDGHVTD